LAPRLQFFFGGYVLFEQREDFRGNGAMSLAGALAKRFVQIVWNALNI
jgi:hypothetical protein